MKTAIKAKEKFIEKIVEEVIIESKELLKKLEEYDKSQIPIQIIVDHFKKTRIYRIISK